MILLGFPRSALGFVTRISLGFDLLSILIWIWLDFDLDLDLASISNRFCSDFGWISIRFGLIWILIGF